MSVQPTVGPALDDVLQPQIAPFRRRIRSRGGSDGKGEDVVVQAVYAFLQPIKTNAAAP